MLVEPPAKVDGSLIEIATRSLPEANAKTSYISTQSSQIFLSYSLYNYHTKTNSV